MTAETIARALGGRRSGKSWAARCPAHDDREPSLSICDSKGKVLVYCHAGCSQRDVIAALVARGLWTETGKFAGRHARKQQNHLPEKPGTDALKRSEAAHAIWRASQEVAGSLVEIYLRSRRVNLVTSTSLRSHYGLKHPSGGVWPVMVALVTRGTDDAPQGIHRTFLAQDGSGKAPVDPQKMMLGPCRGGAVRLAEPRDVLMVGEGIETCLAAMQATGHAAWAALSTSGMVALDLPESVRDVIVLADGDDPGEAAAHGCALRWKREGRRVRIARPPQGQDFNDMLLVRTSHIQEGAL